jgi:thymidylate kinase
MRIVLSGIDGSGKSAHARGVVAAGRKKGIDLKIIWARRVALSLPLMAFCRLTRITKVYENKNGFTVSEYPFYVYTPLRLVRPWLLVLDWFYFDLYIKIYQAFTHTSIVFDRYTLDAFVDVLADVRDPIGAGLLERLLIVSLTKNMSIVLLDTDEATAIERKKDIPSFQYLWRRRRTYIQLANKYGWTVIETKDSYQIVNSKICSALFGEDRR